MAELLADTIRQLAEEIAEDLLTVGVTNERGDHLNVVKGSGPDGKYLAGWADHVVAARIETHVRRGLSLNGVRRTDDG